MIMSDDYFDIQFPLAKKPYNEPGENGAGFRLTTLTTQLPP